MRLAYFGTPAMAVPQLHALVAAGHDIALVITRVDKRRGRGNELSPSPVKAAALELGLPVSHDVDDVLGKGIELGVVVAFGQLIKPHVLAEVPMVNSHFSLLPRWRGAAPVERALLAGDAETGVCLMQLEEGLDTGGVYDTVRLPIGPTTTAEEMRRDLVAIATEQLVRCLAQPLPTPAPQQGEPVYAAKIKSDDLRLDWAGTAEQADRVIRVGGAWTTFRGKRVKVLAATLQPGLEATAPCPLSGLAIGIVQPEGKGPMAYADFARGARPQPGEWFE
ncbi:MAG: methionyl-tRNA formyltransferase [Ilumatobacteraceae bacterium]